jgi:predicted DsbA family dithiol-disulfide isomerase
MNKRIKIDFVSDISCAWCVIGLRSLEEALRRVGEEVTPDMHFQPFELNPQIGAAGEDIAEHLRQKYGATPDESERNRDAIRARGAQVGFNFRMSKRNGATGRCDPPANCAIPWSKSARESERGHSRHLGHAHHGAVSSRIVTPER